MRALFDPDIDPESSGKGLFEADADAEPDHGGERAVRYCGGYVDR